MQLSKHSIAISLASLASLTCLTFNSYSPATAATTQCANGTLIGRYALRSEQTRQFVRAGIGARSALGAQSSRIGGNTSWETFDIYDLGNRNGLNGNTYALRSTQAPNRWVRVGRNQLLSLGTGCTTSSKSRLFVANRIGNVLQLQSLSNQQWVILRSNNLLYANAATAGGNVPRALQYKMIRLSSGQDNTAPAPSPTPQVNLNGWFQGNNKGHYAVQRSGNKVQMKGFLNGKPFNLITGTIQGNIINASWKNYCNSSTGTLKLRIEGNKLTKIGGTPGFNTSWSPSQRPSDYRTSSPDCNSVSNLSGTWRGNRAGTYVIRQTGNIISWTGRGNNFSNIFIGQRSGNMVTGFWQDTAGSQTQNSGQLTFKVVNGSTLQRVNHTGALGNSSWSR